MATITENLRDRLIAEAEEAENQGLIKIAENLTTQIERSQVRENTEPYSYSKEQFQKDVESSLWDVIVRASDFYGKHIDASQAQGIVSSAVENIISEFRVIANVKTGAFEPPVPGEEKVELKVEDDE